ncbi:MAG: hypothetical protein WC476_09055 [Phycisphaerae bacterium]|jgi:hypothetical protein
MNTKKLAFYLLAGILAGCIPVMSLHPLYTEKDIAFDGKIIGTWADDSNETTWQFSDANKPEGAYNLIFTDKEGEKGLFVAHLVKLDSKLFLDVYPDEMPWDEKGPNKTKWRYNTVFLIPAHTFIKINAIEPQLKLLLTDDDDLKKLLKENPNAIEHALIEDANRLVLTAPTKELQAFVLKYADDSRLFTEESILTRKKTEKPQGTTGQKPDDVNGQKPNAD